MICSCKNVKSDLRSLPTYAHRRRPTLYFLCLKRARKPRTANSNCIRCAVQMQLKKFTTEVKKWSIFLTCWFLSLILFYMVLGGDDNRESCRGLARLSKMGGCKGGSWGWLGLKMAALHRPLYKVSFHLGGGLRGRGLVSDRGGSSPPAYIPDKLNAQLEYSILHSNKSFYICLWLTSLIWITKGLKGS